MEDKEQPVSARLRVITMVWRLGIITYGALLAFRTPLRITFTCAWALFLFFFLLRKTIAPEIKDHSYEWQDLFTFVVLFFITTFGVLVVAMWITHR